MVVQLRQREKSDCLVMCQQAFSPRWYRSPPKRRRLQTQIQIQVVAANTAQFAPGNGQGINVPAGFKVSVFASGLNMPTGIAFRSAGAGFEVYVLESGHGLPSACNDEYDNAGGNLRREQSLYP